MQDCSPPTWAAAQEYCVYTRFVCVCARLIKYYLVMFLYFGICYKD